MFAAAADAVAAALPFIMTESSSEMAWGRGEGRKTSDRTEMSIASSLRPPGVGSMDTSVATRPGDGEKPEVACCGKAWKAEP